MPSPFVRSLIVIAFAASASTASGAASVADATLEDLVGATEYAAMGLDKLTADEQARLARWLKLRTVGRPLPVGQPTVSFGIDTVTVTATLAAPAVAAPAPAAAATPAAPAPAPAVTTGTTIGTTAAFGLPQDDVDGEIKELRARVVGAFTGWDGKTVFTLDNGQVWRQSTPGTYRFKATDPEVVIEKSFLGYKLRLVETRRSIAVRRVK